MSAAFSLDSYVELLCAFFKRGYSAVDFHGVDPAARHLVLRHDIDMSLSAAVEMAEAEAKLETGAIYFVLLGTEFYNPWSADGRAALHAVAGLGHEIGLHLDASLYPDDPAALETAAAAECHALESIVERPVRTISFHRPARALQGREGALAGRRHAYEPRFFSEMGYCSDSRGAWHHGQPLDHPAVLDGRALQLLTHPIWWVGEPASPEDRLARFQRQQAAFLDLELARQCDVHEPQISGEKRS